MDVNSTLTRHFRSLSLEERARQQRLDRPIVPLRRPVAPAPADTAHNPHAAAVVLSTVPASAVNENTYERALTSEPKRASKRPAEVPVDALEPVAAETRTHKRLSLGRTPASDQVENFVVHEDYLAHAAATSTFQPALPRPTLPLLRPLHCDMLDQAQRRQLLQVARELTQVTTRSGARTVLERATASVEEQFRGKATR